MALEVYDAQAAKATILKAHGAFGQGGGVHMKVSAQTDHQSIYDRFNAVDPLPPPSP